MATILIAADVCPIEGNLPSFRSGDGRSLLNDLYDEVHSADLVVANLECPLIEKLSPILKTGPTFGEATDCIRGIQAAGIDVLGLANNHILDHGPEGLLTTLQTCERAGIRTVGAGENLPAARRILICPVGRVRIGLLAVAEHEFSIATSTSAGAAPLDPIDLVRNLREHQSEFDYLIVLLHGSHEFLVPTPRIQNACRFLIEMGAHAVVVQHPHCLGGYETHHGGHVVYGQGAFLMDEAIYRDLPSFHEGFLVRITLDDSARASVEFVPFVQSVPVPGARRLSSEAEKNFRRVFDQRSQAIQDAAFVESEWTRFCEERRHAYLSGLLGHGRILRRLNARGFLERSLYGARRIASVRNLVCCETHREALESLFSRRLI